MPPVDAHQIMDNNASANRLELFINKVTSKIASPLIPLICEPPKQAPAKRQAAQSLSRVPASQ